MKLKTAVMALMGLAACSALGEGVLSAPMKLIASPSSVYWTTLVTATPSFNCLWPKAATRATFTARGRTLNVRREFERGAADRALTISDVVFPVPATHEDACLYTLTLTFDSGEAYTSRVAQVRGALDSGTRVLTTADLESTDWQRVRGNHVLIPIYKAGIETVTLNDETVESGLNGHPGWFEWLKMPIGVNTFTAGTDTATFQCVAGGFMIIVR